LGIAGGGVWWNMRLATLLTHLFYAFVYFLLPVVKIKKYNRSIEITPCQWPRFIESTVDRSTMLTTTTTILLQ